MRRFLFYGSLFMIATIGFTIGRLTVRVENVNQPNSLKRIFKDLPTPPKLDAKPMVSVLTTTIDIPAIGSVVPKQFGVSGRAPATVGVLTIDLVDVSGALVLSDKATVVIMNAKDAYGKFATSFALPTGVSGKITINVRDATGVLLVSRIVTVSSTSGFPISIGFVPVSNLCGQVIFAKRTVSEDASVFRGAVELLLQGPTADELSMGMASAFPAKTTLKSVAIDSSGVVSVDFNSVLATNLKKPCQVVAIREQVKQTLVRFPEVREVSILINGNESGLFLAEKNK